MQIDIPKGVFKLRNKKKVYITHSDHGHYTKRKGKSLMEEIINQKPKYILIEKHPQKSMMLSPSSIKKSCAKSEIRRIDKDWAIIAGEKSKAKIIMFDIPRQQFNKNIFKAYYKYNKRISIIRYVSFNVISHLLDLKGMDAPISWKDIYSNTEKRILNCEFRGLRKVVNKESVRNIFNEWLKLIDYTREEIELFSINSLSAMMYFVFLFPVSMKRDKHMIKIIEKYSQKNKVVVVVGSGHIKTWLENKWIEKL